MLHVRKIDDLQLFLLLREQFVDKDAQIDEKRGDPGIAFFVLLQPLLREQKLRDLDLCFLVGVCRIFAVVLVDRFRKTLRGFHHRDKMIRKRRIFVRFQIVQAAFEMHDL